MAVMREDSILQRKGKNSRKISPKIKNFTKNKRKRCNIFDHKKFQQFYFILFFCIFKVFFIFWIFPSNQMEAERQGWSECGWWLWLKMWKFVMKCKFFQIYKWFSNNIFKMAEEKKEKKPPIDTASWCYRYTV